MNYFEDEQSIIRCKGRIVNSALPYKTKYPILLSKEHELTALIVRDCHNKVHHRGIKQTLTELRREYWILKGRSFVKKIIHGCITCKRIHGRPYSYPNISMLPTERLLDDRPFQAVGVDLCGPLFIKNIYKDIDNEGESINKCHIVLFTCASTRGVVLDLVRDKVQLRLLNVFGVSSREGGVRK